MSLRKPQHVCIVRNCKSRTLDNNVRLFRIPKDDRQRTLAWLEAANRMDLKDKSSNDLNTNFRICALHFKKTVFYNESRLMPTAIPTEFDDVKTSSSKRPHQPSSLSENSPKKIKITSDIIINSPSNSNKTNNNIINNNITNNNITNNNITNTSNTNIINTNNSDNVTTMEFKTNSDHTYHKVLNAEVQKDVDKSASSLKEPEPSILEKVLTAATPVETIDLTSSTDDPESTREAETSKKTTPLKSYLLIPKQFVKFIPGATQETILLPPSLPAPEHFIKYPSESPKKRLLLPKKPVLIPKKLESSKVVFVEPPKKTVDTPTNPTAKEVFESYMQRMQYTLGPPTSTAEDSTPSSVLERYMKRMQYPLDSITSKADSTSLSGKTITSTSSIPAPTRYTCSQIFTVPCDCKPTSTVTTTSSMIGPYMRYAPETPKTTQNSKLVQTPGRYTQNSQIFTVPCDCKPTSTLTTTTSSIIGPYMRYAPETPKTTQNSKLVLSSASTIKAVPDIPKKIQLNTSQTQTDKHLLSAMPTISKQRNLVRSLSRKNARLQKLLKLRKDPKPSIELFNKHCDVFLTPPMAEFVKLQAQLCKVSERGRRYNDEYKEFAEHMYSLGPRCYRYLQTLFCLPSMKSLRREKRAQENGNIKQEHPVESLQHVPKEIKCLPELNNVEQPQNVPEDIECLPEINNLDKFHNVSKEMKSLPQHNNGQQLQSIKSVKPISQLKTYLSKENNKQSQQPEKPFQNVIIQQIRSVPESENRQFQPKEKPVIIQRIQCLPDVENKQEAIKSLETIVYPMTSLPDLSEL